jgi:hypothetical protein
MISIRSFFGKWDTDRIFVIISVVLASIIAYNVTEDNLLQLALILILGLLFLTVFDFLYSMISGLLQSYFA